MSFCRSCRFSFLHLPQAKQHMNSIYLFLDVLPKNRDFLGHLSFSHEIEKEMIIKPFWCYYSIAKTVPKKLPKFSLVFWHCLNVISNIIKIKLNNTLMLWKSKFNINTPISVLFWNPGRLTIVHASTTRLLLLIPLMMCSSIQFFKVFQTQGTKISTYTNLNIQSMDMLTSHNHLC